MDEKETMFTNKTIYGNNEVLLELLTDTEKEDRKESVSVQAFGNTDPHLNFETIKVEATDSEKEVRNHNSLTSDFVDTCLIPIKIEQIESPTAEINFQKVDGSAIDNLNDILVTKSDVKTGNIAPTSANIIFLCAVKTEVKNDDSEYPRAFSVIQSPSNEEESYGFIAARPSGISDQSPLCKTPVTALPQSAGGVKKEVCDGELKVNPSPNSVEEADELDTREIASRITSELKRLLIPQSLFAKRVLGRSQGTLSDLLRNPKPWSKMQTGRKTFLRMWEWLQKSESERLSLVKLKSTEVVDQENCKRRKPKNPTENTLSSKKLRIVFTDLQRYTLRRIFKEMNRPSKEMQLTIAEKLGLNFKTVNNFFMNARRRCTEKWKDDISEVASELSARHTV